MDSLPTALLLARVQFAFTVSFHFIFPAFSIGLASYLAVLEGLWLAPVQAVVATIVSDADAYAGEVADALRQAGIRVSTDLRNEKINYKVREHSLARVPNLLVIGKREAEERNVALRPLGADARQEVLPLEALVERLRSEALPPDLRSGNGN